MCDVRWIVKQIELYSTYLLFSVRPRYKYDGTVHHRVSCRCSQRPDWVLVFSTERSRNQHTVSNAICIEEVLRDAFLRTGSKFRFAFLRSKFVLF
jgi:hypothetical protein